MKIHVVAVGKIREKSLRAVADDYLERVRHYARTTEIELKGDAELERAVPRDATVIALDPNGAAVTMNTCVFHLLLAQVAVAIAW